MANRKVVPVAGKFIERGIEKYRGVVDEALRKKLELAECHYIPYRFADGRYLLVQPDTGFGFLYADLDLVYEKLVLN